MKVMILSLILAKFGRAGRKIKVGKQVLHISRFAFSWERLVLASMKSYRPHNLTQASYDPKLHFAKI